MDNKHWRVVIKVKAMKQTITSELRGPYDREDVIEHYGLEEPDVEWYTIEELDDKIELKFKTSEEDV